MSKKEPKTSSFIKIFSTEKAKAHPAFQLIRRQIKESLANAHIGFVTRHYSNDGMVPMAQCIVEFHPPTLDDEGNRHLKAEKSNDGKVFCTFNNDNTKTFNKAYEGNISTKALYNDRAESLVLQAVSEKQVPTFNCSRDKMLSNFSSIVSSWIQEDPELKEDLVSAVHQLNQELMDRAEEIAEIRQNWFIRDGMESIKASLKRYSGIPPEKIKVALLEIVTELVNDQDVDSTLEVL